MLAKELLNELKVLRRQRPDFDTLEVYVDVLDQRSYDEEQAVASRPLDEAIEVTESVVAVGIVYDIMVPTAYDLDGDTPVPRETYVLLRAVEDTDTPAPMFNAERRTLA